MTLLTRHNPKLEKNEKYGWKSFGLHLAPFIISGNNTCPNASKGCAAACLNSAGQGIYKRVQEARIRKTNMFYTNREEFLKQLHKEISSKVNTAAKTGAKVSFRLNLTSDIPWETVKYQGKSMMEHFPTVQFYDYTKNLKRVLNSVSGKFPKNYHLTFSRSEKNKDACKIVMACGGNIAVVFDNKLPKTHLGKRVIDATLHDLRFLDPKKTVAGLIALGKARKDNSGFVVKTR